jgi:polyphosphate kinase
MKSNPSRTEFFEPSFFDRDISWLSFNERVLLEAAKDSVPLHERLKFLAIYSSNLDEFYRVRIPAIMALKKLEQEKDDLLKQVKTIIENHQEQYGKILRQDIIPALRENHVHFLYGETIPENIIQETSKIFFTRIAAFLQLVRLSRSSEFFPENNKIYLAVLIQQKKKEEIVIVNVPSESLPRFYTVSVSDKTYILILDDIIRQHLNFLFDSAIIKGAYSFKVTRDAELGLREEYTRDIAKRMEKLLARRDYGFATRLLYDTSMPDVCLKRLTNELQLTDAAKMAGGRYHNLKDLFSFPLKDSGHSYTKWSPVSVKPDKADRSVFTLIDERDVMLHTPYHDYNVILRFFSESAIDANVEEIYVALYRIAVDSAIGQALMTAARNGKKVTVFVELKARFDEANNIRWAKKMKDAGVRIVYSIPGFKVHAKVALVKRKNGSETRYYGLFSTGNFNENTARLYTDHTLLTVRKELVKELQTLFKFLSKRKTEATTREKFAHLLVAPFNLRERFIALIDREIMHARQGKKAYIKIKLNNLEEEVLIHKLYEASIAGVHISLIVRSICRIIPGVPGLSDKITVRRIVDRYLEHGRVYIFQNGGKEEVFCGSADWMNRNIYHRIEVCFPIYDERIKAELKSIVELQLADNVQAVSIDNALRNCPIPNGQEKIHSQQAIYKMISSD